MFTLDRATFQANETHLLSVVCWHNEGPDPAKFNISLSCVSQVMYKQNRFLRLDKVNLMTKIHNK